MCQTFLASILFAISFVLSVPVMAAETSTFIKLDATGRELPDQAVDWDMVWEPATGLTWEIKSTDGSLHDRDNCYTWKDSESIFIHGLNKERFGGFADWRLPEDKELERLQKLSENNPELFARYFPRTAPSLYWTWSRCQDGTHNSAKLKFGPEPSPHARLHRIRAVRGEQK